VSLVPPTKVGQLQDALHAKAKGSPNYRFYALYDKMYRADVLWHALRICQVNGGAPGVDGQTFEDIEKYGQMRWLRELAEELRTTEYRPKPVRRVYIPKPGKPGRTRPLGIPTIKDRVVMTAAMLVLEPVFEADLPPEQNAYRPNRSALDAVKQVSALLHSHHQEVIDADLSGYFDSIPHAELMKSVARRISDRHILGLIKMWLQAPVEETDERGRKRRTTPNKDTGRGTPQGAPITPPTILQTGNCFWIKSSRGNACGPATAKVGIRDNVRRVNDLRTVAIAGGVSHGRFHVSSPPPFAGGAGF